MTDKIATEGGHWYALDGSPMYEIPAKNGNLRPTTLRDARKLNLVPSVTTILNCAAKPGLNRWLQDQAIDAALTLPRLEDEPLDEYRRRVVMDAAEQSRKARDRGTELHGAIERAFSQQAISAEDEEFVAPVVELVTIRYGHGHPEHSFAHPLGYGGKLDWHNDDVVLDFKTKDFGPDDDVLGYDEHHMQLCAYANGVYRPKAKLVNVFISTRIPGLTSVTEWDDKDYPRSWEMFKSLLTFWQHKNRYWPALEVAA